MGDPRKLKNAYQRPRRPWEAERLAKEKKVVEKYGIRRKHELWRVQSILREYRNRAKELIANPDETKQAILIQKLNSLGVIPLHATLDDILSLQTDALLERRLQTVVTKKQLANTAKQARQFIVHGHIEIGGQKVISPGYIVPVAEEALIAFKQTSALAHTFKVAERKKTKEELAAEAAEKKDKEEIVLETEELLGDLDKEEEETEGKPRPKKKGK